MLSLLTYGATLGVAEVASTRHERNTRRSQKLINPFDDRSFDRDSTKHSAERSTKRLRATESDYQTKDSLEHQIKDSPPYYGEVQAQRHVNQEQHTTKGGIGGWLRRLIQHQT